MSPLLVLLVISAAFAKDTSSETNPDSSKTEGAHLAEYPNLRKLVSDLSKGKSNEQDSRKSRSYGFPYFPQHFMNFQTHDLGYYQPQGKTPMSQEWRTEPFKRKNNPQQLLDSPVYYVRLPASPYVFIPGVGYVSRPPSISDPLVLNALTGNKPEEEELQVPSADSNFINLPIDFVSNGKPTGVYQLNKPNNKPVDSGFYALDKGPYLFNGKPIEFYFIRNSYNRLYADALTNFYP